MVKTFELVADPTRRRLLDELRGGERSVGELVAALGMSQPAVSKHLRALREAGLASVRMDAQRRIYRLEPGPLEEIDAWLAPYRRYWNERLDGLERTLDEMEDRMDGTLIKDGRRYTMRFERELAHPPEKVWRAITEREFLRQWFPCDIEGGWEPGAVLKFTFPDEFADMVADEDTRGEVLTVDPGRLLEFRWGRDSVLRMELEPAPAGCRFVLSDTVTDGSILARDAAGWEYCIHNLVLVLDGSPAEQFDADAWRVPFERYVAKFEPVAGAQQGPPGEGPG